MASENAVLRVFPQGRKRIFKIKPSKCNDLLFLVILFIYLWQSWRLLGSSKKSMTLLYVVKTSLLIQCKTAKQATGQQSTAGWRHSDV